MFGDAFEVSFGEMAQVKKLSGEEPGTERQMKLESLKYDPERYQARISIDGEPRTIQVGIVYGWDLSCFFVSRISWCLTSYPFYLHRSSVNH